MDGREKPNTEYGKLFDMENDLGEKNDLAKKYPEKVKELSDKIENNEKETRLWCRTGNRKAPRQLCGGRKAYVERQIAYR